MGKAKKSRHSLKYEIILLSVVAAALTLFNIAIFVDNNVSISQVLGASTQTVYSPNLTEEADFWQNFIIDHPTYRDAYLELADIYQKLGDSKRSADFYQTAKLLDPNNLSF